MPIQFRSETRVLEVVTPQGTLVHYPVEYRWDPLTSRLSVICPHLKDKWSGSYNIRDEVWLNKLIEESRHGCPFCRPGIERITAKFPQSWLERETLKFDGVYAFPNLYPRTDFEAVITSPDAHALNQAGPSTHFHLLNAAVECIKMAIRNNSRLRYPVIGCNYLSPAGASLTHFHMQVSIQEFPFNHIQTMIDCTRHYRAANNEDYWPSLIEANTEREIKRGKNVYWHTPFAPTGFSEVRAIINKPGMLGFTRDDTEELADGLSRILTFYREQGFSAFNYILYSAEPEAQAFNFPPGFQIVARPNPRPDYVSTDTWYMPLLMGQTVVIEEPEKVAEHLKNYFQGTAR